MKFLEWNEARRDSAWIRNTAILLFTLFVCRTAAAPSDRVVLAENGAGRAAVILPDDAIPVQKLAAREFLHHVREATGADLPLYRESEAPADAEYRVYIGPCRATVAAGIETESLPPSGHIVRTVGNALYLAGLDRDRGRLLRAWQTDWQGTLNAVYDFLETDMGVRWLFPGELGEEIPSSPSLSVGPLHRRGEPRYRMALWRPAGDNPSAIPFWPAPEQGVAFQDAQRLFLLRHRFGAAENLHYTHAFGRYWRRFGESNPEFFHQLPDGTRRPLDGRPSGVDISLCVSSPGLRTRIIRDWQRSPERNPEHIPHRPYLNACENDTPGMCVCAKCRAWDAPDPGFASHPYWGHGVIPHVSRRFTLARTPWGELEEGDAEVGDTPSLSDRYARFYMKLLREARRFDPGARLAGYAYANYREAPVNPKGDLDLNGVLILYVPAVGVPYTAAMQETFREEWDAWRGLGARMVLRPNLTHDGGNLPVFYARKMADDFSYAAARGLEATFFDSLTGAWSAQGPTLYTLTRIHRKPDWPVERILDEYYAAFGPAEAGVRAYFGYWERHADGLDPEAVRRWKGEERGGGFKNYVRIAHRLFHPEHFAEARALLDEARLQAAEAEDDRAQRRVAYLEQGLTDAELTTAARAAQARMERDPNARTRAAFDAAFRQLTEARATMAEAGDHPADFGYFAFRERHGSRFPHLGLPTDRQLANETDFQARWPNRVVRDPAEAGLRLVETVRLSRSGWRFRLDPDRDADRRNWRSPDTDVQGWRAADIEAPWSAFLGRPEVGAGWYRRTIEIPALPERGAAFLRFVGVDESAWVWVNGEYAGRHHIGPEGWDIPFRIEITPLVKPGENTLVVRVMNTAYEGGIWRPVHLEIFREEGAL